VELADGTPLPAEQGQFDLFHCLQSTDQECQLSDKASLAVRAGQPANPIALSANGAPVLGTSLELSIDHATFAPAATLDLFAFGHQKLNVPVPSFGTLLVSPFTVLSGAPGQTLAVAIPLQTSLIGFELTVQGASQSLAGFQLTNALDTEIGTH
jgi:hypothetical protein